MALSQITSHEKLGELIRAEGCLSKVDLKYEGDPEKEVEAVCCARANSWLARVYARGRCPPP